VSYSYCRYFFHTILNPDRINYPIISRSPLSTRAGDSESEGRSSQSLFPVVQEKTLVILILLERILELQMDLSTHSTHISRIGIVPSEILSEVFIRCIHFYVVEDFQSRRFWNKDGILPSYYVISTLIQVSRKWLQTVLATPLLFTQIIIVKTIPSMPWNILHKNLHYSGNLELDICIQDLDAWPRPPCDSFGPLTQNMHRTRILILDASRHLSMIFPRLQEILAPRLQYLELDARSFGLESDEPCLELGTLVANRLLRYRSNSSMPLCWNGGLFKANNMKDYCDTHIPKSAKDFVGILQQFPLLEKCSLLHFDEEFPLDSSPVINSRLVDLRIDWLYRGSNPTSILWPGLHFPNLISLVFTMNGWNSNWVHRNLVSAVRSFISFSKPPIKSFSWTGVCMNVHDLEDLLHTLPLLEALTLRYCSLEPGTMAPLNRKQSPKLGPKIHSLNFTGTSIPQEELLSAIQSRIERRADSDLQVLRHAFLQNCGLESDGAIQLSAWTRQCPGFVAVADCPRVVSDAYDDE